MKQSMQMSGLIFFFLFSVSTFYAKAQTNFIWGRLGGTDKEEYVLNHLTDLNGNIYVSGKTTGAFEGTNSGKNDGFIIKIDSSGNTLWAKQFRTPADEDVLWSAIDEKGCVYITGSTKGALAGRNYGKEDIFVAKYNPDGQQAWMRQFGTDSTDIGSGIHSGKNGFVYVTGATSGVLGKSSAGLTDGFIMKLDRDGNLISTLQFGSPANDFSVSISGDENSRLYVCGSTWGDIASKNAGMIDAFAAVFSDKGELLKITQFGTDGFDMALLITADSKQNIYVGGTTSGSLGGKQAGEGDCFLTKISDKGEIFWHRQFGTAKHDGVRGLTLNNKVTDNILVSGIMNLPDSYSFIQMYSPEGKMVWERNFSPKGTNGNASGKDVTIDNKGNIYHLGLTGTNLFGSLIGGHDFYLVKMQLDGTYMNH